MNQYRTLDIVPDFSDDPIGGVYVPRSDTAIAAGEIFSRWPARNARTQAFRFVFRGPTEVRAMRAFLQAVRGPFLPFFCPSWMRDFGATGTVAAGDTEMVIDTDPAEWIAADRPDTFGRTIYVYTLNRGLHVTRIRSAVDNGGGTWTLTLAQPFPWAADLARCLCGIAWFVHFAGNEFEWRHLTPDRCEIDAAVIEGKNYQANAGTYAITPVTIYESEPFDTLVETDADPPVTTARTMQCLGPDEWSTAQDLNFSATWTFTLQDGTVTIESGTESHESALFDGTDAATMISGAFDVLGDEAIAWQDTFETIELRWYDSGTPQELTVTGRTPVLFQNWTINGDISGGDGDVVLYYLKTHEPRLFARYQRDDFATEYTAAILPVAPLALLGNVISGQNHVIRAISARHTLLEIRSEPYLLPPPRARDEALGEETTTAAVNQMVIDGAGDDAGATGDEAVAAAVNYMVIDGTADDPGTTGEETVTAAVNFMVIDGDAGEDEILADEATAGSYSQIAQDAAGEDTATATETTTGTYGTP